MLILSICLKCKGIFFYSIIIIKNNQTKLDFNYSKLKTKCRLFRKNKNYLSVFLATPVFKSRV